MDDHRSDGACDCERCEETVNVFAYSWYQKQFENLKNKIMKPQHEEPTEPPSGLSLSLIVGGILVYVFDIYTDIDLAIHYYQSPERRRYFLPTLLFIIVPAIILTFVNIVLYIAAKDNCSKARWFFRILFIWIGPIYRDVEAIVYGVKHGKAYLRKYKMFEENAAACLLKLLEAFFEAAPQAILQAYILIVDWDEAHFYIFFKVGIAFTSIAWTLASLNRSIEARDGRLLITSYFGSAIYCLCNFFIIAARCFVVAAFASAYSLEIFIYFCLYRYSMMVGFNTAAIVNKKRNIRITTFTKLAKLVFLFVTAWIYCFVFFNFENEARKQKTTVFFYLILLIENTFLIFAWMYSLSTSELLAAWHIWAVVFHYILLLLGAYCFWLYNSRYHISNYEFDILQEPLPYKRRINTDEKKEHSVTDVVNRLRSLELIRKANDQMNAYVKITLGSTKLELIRIKQDYHYYYYLNSLIDENMEILKSSYRQLKKDEEMLEKSDLDPEAKSEVKCDIILKKGKIENEYQSLYWIDHYVKPNLRWLADQWRSQDRSSFETAPRFLQPIHHPDLSELESLAISSALEHHLPSCSNALCNQRSENIEVSADVNIPKVIDCESDTE